MALQINGLHLLHKLPKRHADKFRMDKLIKCTSTLQPFSLQAIFGCEGKKNTGWINLILFDDEFL